MATRTRKRGREPALDDDAAPPSARTPRRLEPSREGASSPTGPPVDDPASMPPPPPHRVVEASSSPAGADDDARFAMPPPPPRRAVEASDAPDDDETAPYFADGYHSGEDSGEETVAFPDSSGKQASEYYGVTRNGKGWQAQIHRPARLGFDGKMFSLGTYPTELAAARAVDLYVHEHMPSLSAKANFPPGHVYVIAPSGPKGRGASKYYGVSRSTTAGHGADWRAQILLGKKLGYDPSEKKHIGCYPTELEAAHAVDDYIYKNVPKAIPKVNFPCGS